MIRLTLNTSGYTLWRSPFYIFCYLDVTKCDIKTCKFIIVLWKSKIKRVKFNLKIVGTTLFMFHKNVQSSFKVTSFLKLL